VADRIVVMNHGRVEQVGGPRDLYEHPANAFVMGFVGPVTRLGELLIRPHDVEVRRQPDGTTSEAMVERLVHLGSRSGPTCSCTTASASRPSCARTPRSWSWSRARSCSSDPAAPASSPTPRPDSRAARGLAGPRRMP
jgi:ABC-type glutathione transport system ATPase component